MPKFYGRVGFTRTEETSPGVWMPVTTEKPYYGDVERRWSRVWVNQSSTNDNVAIKNTISIVADPFLRANLGAIKWVEWLDTKWKVTEIDTDYPRVNLTLGEVYNLE